MATMKAAPLNEMCPIKPDRRADPDITAKNSKGEVVAFCCRGCVNKFSKNCPTAMNNNMISADNGMNATEGTEEKDTYS